MSENKFPHKDPASNCKLIEKYAKTMEINGGPFPFEKECRQERGCLLCPVYSLIVERDINVIRITKLEQEITLLHRSVFVNRPFNGEDLIQ